MSDEPKRRYWQLHLSTGVVFVSLMLVIVLLMMLEARDPVSIDDKVTVRCFGRPVPWLFLYERIADINSVRRVMHRSTISEIALLINIVFYALGIFLICRWNERRIFRRSEARKP